MFSSNFIPIKPLNQDEHQLYKAIISGNLTDKVNKKVKSIKEVKADYIKEIELFERKINRLSGKK